MAREISIQLDSFLDTGLTLLGKIFDKLGVQKGSNISLSEVSSALYVGDFDTSSLDDGEYIVRFETASGFYGVGSLFVRDGEEVEAWEIVDANIAKVNGYTVDGRGTENSPWGPA